jgi:hypothetical protein
MRAGEWRAGVRHHVLLPGAGARLGPTTFGQWLAAGAR